MKQKSVTFILILLITCINPSIAQDTKLLLNKSFSGYSFFKVENQLLKNNPVKLIDSTYYWRWDKTAATWKLIYKYTDVVYENGKLKSSALKSWKGTTWDDYQSFTFEYGTGTETIFTKQWNGTIWSNYLQELYTYDANDNETEAIYQSWNGSSWENTYKISMTYDSNNNKLSETHQTGKNLINASRDLYTYDNDNKLTINEIQEYDTIKQSWIPFNRRLNTYDNNNKLEFEDHQYWEDTVWRDISKATFTYDAKGKLVHKLVQDVFFGLENSMQNSYIYDGGNNLIKDVEQHWKLDDKKWVNFSVTASIYNGDNYRTDYCMKRFDSEGTSIEFGDSAHTYYREVTSGFEEMNEDELIIYPNPSSGQFTIDYAQPIKNIEIYSITGEKVMTQTSKHVALSSFAKGLYFLKIYDNKKVQVRKIILE